jgi:cytochrome c biogenesis protein CcmG/thiol:disulfide interchange protein DsbE
VTAPTDPAESSVGDVSSAGDPSSLSVGRHRWSRPKWLVALGVVLLAVLVTVAVWQAVDTSPNADSTALVGPTGQPAPAFTLPSLSDPTHSLSLAMFRGRPLVINFWASWCVPCRTEMPLLEAASRSERGRVAFLGIDANDTSSAARAFLAQVHVTYPAVSDPSGTMATNYGLFGLPTTIFVSSTGKILGRHIGELHAATLRAALREAFGA